MRLPRAGAHATTWPKDRAIQTVTLSFFRFARLTDRLWAFAQMGLARPAMARTPDLGFWKLFGSGSGEGFTPIPNTAVYAILCVWPDGKTARTRLAQSPVFARYRRRAAENMTLFLEATQVRGQWSGQTPFEAQSSQMPGPLAALTRATIKPGILLKFWKRTPAISAVIGADPNVAFKIGIGEVPWLQQVTFSIWPNTEAMASFARTSGPHARAIKAVREGNWFREELYARFHILESTGSWMGQNPLAALPREPAT